MAGCTSNLSPFKPPLVSRGTSLPSSLNPLNPNSIKLNPNRPFTSPISLSLIIARYGRPNFNDRRSRDRKTEISIDPAVDISTIRSAVVRLIDDKQNVVILSPEADPPVLKIMDYNKYKYEQQKKKKEQQKKSSATRMDQKELKMGYNIDVHDYSVRLRAAIKFLNDGDKVKVIVQLKGRENEFRSNAIELIKRFQNDVGELATEESKSLRDRNMFVVLIPNKALQQKAQDTPKKKEKPPPPSPPPAVISAADAESPHL
ncbi:Translation initiation factor IF3-2 [Ranunculus cassubicifolius]